MRLLRLKVAGITTYQMATLDLENVPAGKIFAVIGPNGAGKTTLLDCMVPGVLERSIRGGPLKKWATSRSSELEAIYSYGGRTIRHQILMDATKGKEEAFLWVDGAPASSGKLPDYDQAIGKIYPPMSVISTSCYTGESTRLRQQAGLMSMKQAERKSLFSFMLGLREYEILCEMAQAEADKLAGSIQTMRLEVASLEAVEIEIQQLEREAADHDVDLQAQQLHLAGVQAQANQLLQAKERKAGALHTLETALRSATRRKSELQGDIARTEGDLTDIETSLAEMATVIESAAQTRAEAAQAEEDAKQETGLRQQIQAAQSHLNRIKKQLEGLNTDIAAIVTDGKSQRDYVRQIEADAEKIPELRQKLEPLAEAREERTRLRTRHQEMVTAIRNERQQQATNEQNAQRRVQSARFALETARTNASLLAGVPCGGAVLEGHDCAACQFLTKAQKAQADIPTFEAEVEAAEAQAADVSKAGLHFRQTQTKADELGQRIARLDSAISGLEPEERKLTAALARVEKLDEAKAMLQRLYHAHGVKKEEAKQLEEEIARATEDVAQHQAALQSLSPALAHVGPRRRSLEKLLGAEARRPDLLQRQKALEADLARFRLALEEVVIPPEPVEAREEVSQATSAWSDAEAQAKAASKELDDLRLRQGELSGRLKEKRAKIAKLPSLRTSLERKAEEVSGAVLLAKGLGRNGIQALKMDAAGPEVSTILNELLRELYGTRFVCRLTTQVPYTDKARAARGEMKEVFDFEIFDSKDGEMKLPADLSKGELVCFDSTLRLALCVFNRARAAAPLETLYFDESTDGLDDSVRPLFMNMLRRAMSLGGFHQCWVVSHNQEVWEQADVLVHVGGGTVRVTGL